MTRAAAELLETRLVAAEATAAKATAAAVAAEAVAAKATAAAEAAGVVAAKAAEAAAAVAAKVTAAPEAATAIAAAEEAAAVADVHRKSPPLAPPSEPPPPLPPTDTVLTEAAAETAEALAAGPTLVEPAKTKPLEEAVPETLAEDEIKKVDEHIKKDQAILEVYSEPKGTVFRVDLENKTAQVKIPEQASISQGVKDGLQSIQVQRKVSKGEKTFTITAITDLGKEVSIENKEQITENLNKLFDALQNDKDFLNKLKEASDLKDKLSKDTASLKDELEKKPDMGYKEISYLTDSIRDKINNLEVLDKALGAKLTNNIKNRDLGKLEKSKNKIGSILKKMWKTVFNGKTIPQKPPLPLVETAAAAVAAGPTLAEPVGPPPPTYTIPAAAAAAETAAEEVGPPLVETAAAAETAAAVRPPPPLAPPEERPPPLETAKVKATDPLIEAAPTTLEESVGSTKETIAAIDSHAEELKQIDSKASALKEIYKNHRSKYSDSEGTVFLVNLEKNTAEVAAGASISQDAKKGWERIQGEVVVLMINEKPYTITAITDVDQGFSGENKQQKRENLEDSVDAIKNDEKFLEKLKESSDLKGDLSKDIQLLLDKLDENPNVGHHALLMFSIQDKMNNLEALNKVLGDTLKENLNKKGLDELLETSKVEESSIAPPLASLKEPDFLDLEVPKETTPQDDRPVLAPPAEKAAAVAEVRPPPLASLKEPDFLDLEVPKETTPQDDRPVLATSAKKFIAFTEATNLGEKRTE